jgi:ATP-dependent DNA helicase DinG
MPPKPPPLPAPADLGFPPKFQRYYDDQLLAIDKAVQNPKRFTALNMPTGSGKSMTGITAALLNAKVHRGIYLTSTTGLQDQLASDFSGNGLYDLRGARHYPCRAIEPGEHLDRYRRGRFRIGCDEGPCHSGVQCQFAPARGDAAPRPSCAYYGAVWDARNAPLIGTSYAMYLANAYYAEGLGQVECLILDEAHDTDKELESFLTFEITVDDARYIGSKMLRNADLASWRDWGVYHKGPLAAKIEQRALFPPADADAAQDMRKLKRIKGVIDRLAGINPLDWILDADPARAKFSPMKVSAYAEQYLFRGVKHVILMSATMTRKTLQLLGIADDDALYWECPSRFPAGHRPIISVNTEPAVRVNHRMNEVDKYLWLRRIERILEPRLAAGWNGIIHTVSYQRMRELVGESEFRDRFIVHDSSNTKEQIQFFKAHPNEGWVLVSPSVVTGYDFPDDECRFQIIGKVPLPDMRGPINAARKIVDKELEGYLAMQKLVQACGRGMRGPQDWCETFIVDDTFADYFLKNNRKHAPKWFKDAVIYVDHIPAPGECLDLIA